MSYFLTKTYIVGTQKNRLNAFEQLWYKQEFS